MIKVRIDQCRHFEGFIGDPDQRENNDNTPNGRRPAPEGRNRLPDVTIGREKPRKSGCDEYKNNRQIDWNEKIDDLEDRNQHGKAHPERDRYSWSRFDPSPAQANTT